jgi:hypothetical protein
MKNKISLNEIKKLVRQVLNEQGLEQEQEIDEEEMNSRIHYGIKEMRDDLTVKWLTHSPKWNWLVDENNFYKDAVIGWNYEYDRPVWYSGTWEEGIWKRGIWKDGTFEGEIWEDGNFYGGTFAGGTWERGNFYGGTFAGETWEYGSFRGGTFNGGIWKSGWFHRGTFAGGKWEVGAWWDGTWIKGDIWDEDLGEFVKSNVKPKEYFKNKKQ